MIRFWGSLSFITFVVSAALHCLTYAPFVYTFIAMNWAWPLHLAAFATFVAMVFFLERQRKRHPVEPVKGVFAGWRTAYRQNQEFQFTLLAVVPRFLQLICAAAFIYTLVNFALFAALVPGSPAVENGTFVLQSHGRKIREISEEEYRRFRAYEVRGFSGHWMLFSLLPTVYFLVAYPRLQGSPADEDRSSR